MRQDNTNARHSIFVLAIIFTIALISCGEEKYCLSYEKAYIIKVEGSTNGHVNQELNFQVYFGCHDGCGQFGNFDENISGNITTITVNAKYEGCICTQDAPTRVTTYKFKSSQAGIYYLKFFQSANTYLTDTITIQ